ncbi:MAG: hypothetical protein WAT16_07670 [Saprospiraceae bacterium]|nr:hypothetical protein [Saprospiraceae bacterium]
MGIQIETKSEENNPILVKISPKQIETLFNIQLGLWNYFSVLIPFRRRIPNQMDLNQYFSFDFVVSLKSPIKSLQLKSF